MSLSSHSSPGTSAAFSFQLERALYWLARSPAGFRIGIETHDDVVVQKPEVSLQLEQDKHSITDSGHPFGDRSRDLWNTLAIWVSAVHDGEVAEGTRFLMVTNKAVPECIARCISDADSEAKVDGCIARLEKAAMTPSVTIAELSERVLSTDHRESLRQVIRSCELADADQNTAGSALRSETIDYLQLPQWCLPSADSIANELLGWLQSQALQLWQQKKAAWIARDNFVNQLHAVLARRRRQISRERSEHLIQVTDEAVGQTKARLFVRQLYLITEDEDVVDASIREFIRCNIEKLRLSEEGNITDDDWVAFDNRLFIRWSKIRARVTRMMATASERDIGFEIFTDTTESHRERLAGSETEHTYLTAGSYHRMADSLELGWHPSFKDLLKE